MCFELFNFNSRISEFRAKTKPWLTLSGPGEGSEARMTKLTAANQKPLTL